MAPVTSFLLITVLAAAAEVSGIVVVTTKKSQHPTCRSTNTAQYASIKDQNTAADHILQNAKQIFQTKKERDDRHFLETARFISTPFFAAIASFFIYPTTSKLFHSTAQFLSKNNWVPVDGGQLQWSILLPALNGVVMTAISLLYANLISTTGTQLRQRQILIQESLNVEVDGIRGLVQLLPYYPKDVRGIFGAYLMIYLQLLVNEIGNIELDLSQLRSAAPPLSDYRDRLHEASVTTDLHDNIRERSYEMLDRITSGRATRITSLQTTFPPLHYVTITTLSLAILFVFLIETDRPVILFLDNFQLRLVWGLLVGTVTAIYCIGIDLSYPFVGTYVVPADQLLDESDELFGLIQNTFTESGGAEEHDQNRRVVEPTAKETSRSSSWTYSGINSVESQSMDDVPMSRTENVHPAAAIDNTDHHVASRRVTSTSAAAPESFEEYMKRRAMGEYNTN